VEQVEKSTHQVTQVLQQSDSATAVAEQVAAVLAQQLEPQEQQALLEQYFSTGKLPAEKLKYKMYAVVKDGLVQGYTWEKSDELDVEYVLMTFENSPAYIQGKYEDGKFYEPERN
jgi:hypothetical protein